MTALDRLITDRTQQDVSNLVAMSLIPWRQMTPEQKGEWLHGKLSADVELEWSDGTPIECTDGILYAYADYRTNKGAYNAQDLNRVGRAISLLTAILTQRGYTITTDTKTDWTVEDLPTVSMTEHYLTQVSRIRAVLPLLPGTPPVPTNMEAFTYEEANDIEKILSDIDSLLTSMQQVYLRAGVPWNVAGNNYYIRN